MPEPVLSRAQQETLAALTQAIYLGETEKALALIEPGLPLDRVPHGLHHTPLLAAIDNGNMAVFDALLAAGAGIAAQDQFGGTPLNAAAHRGDEAMVRALLDRGAEVNAAIVRPKHQFNGRTALMGAAASGKLAVVKLLLERGADPLAKDANGWTALTFAEMHGKRIAEHLRNVMNDAPAASGLSLFDAARAGLAERVRALGRAYVGFALSRPPLYRLMFGPPFAAPDAHPALAEASLASFAVLEGAVRARLGGDAPAQRIHGTAMGAWAMVHGLAMLILDRKALHNAPGRAAETALVDSVVGLFSAGLERRA